MNEYIVKELEKINKDNGYMFIYPVKLPPREIEKILRGLGHDFHLGSNWNGCDLDWSTEHTINGIKYSIFGSAYDGSFVFEKIN